MKAIIIDEQWIELILDGKKTWEMRPASTKERGLIGLIKKGTKQIHGVANLVDCLAKIEPHKLMGNQKYHAIPTRRFRFAIDMNWLNPWVLAGARRLTRPVSYVHKSQVSWVNLDLAVEEAILKQIGRY